VCIRHGAKVKGCSSEGCTNIALKGGVCVRHGAKVKECSTEGCSNQARSGGVCLRHGAKRKQCSKEGCTNQAHKEEHVQGMEQTAIHTMNLLHSDQSSTRLLQL
jgi:hypothetical protein